MVLVCGVGCVLFFAGWLLGGRSDTLEAVFDSLPVAGVAFGALLALPFFFYYAWQQAGAKARLSEASLPVCPALGHAVGAQGGRPPRSVWRFATREDPMSIIVYYESAVAAHGWKPERRKNGLLLTKAGDSAAIWWESSGEERQIVIQKPAPQVR